MWWRRAASAPSENDDSATAPAHSAIAQSFRTSLMRASGANQLPVRIARGGIAGEGPDVGNVGNLVRVAVDDIAGLIAGDRDHLRDKAHGELRGSVTRFGADELGLVDRDEARLRLLLGLLSFLDRGIEALIDLRRQEVAQGAAV